MKLIIDHVMFPVYDNNKFLKKVYKEWKKNKKYDISIGKQNDRFRGIYLFSTNFYIEHLSTTINNPYWNNALCIVVDKKYWKYYKHPDEISDDYLIPKYGCGYFLIDPQSKFRYKHGNKNIGSQYDNFTILISKKLEISIKKICGLDLQLPKYIKTCNNFTQHYDIAVIDNNIRIAPLFQSNTPNIEN